VYSDEGFSNVLKWECRFIFEATFILVCCAVSRGQYVQKMWE